MNRVWHCIAGMRGMCLTELLVALPLMTLLMTGMLFLLTSVTKPYAGLRHNLEMRQQVRFALEGMVQDITYGDAFICEENRLRILTRRKNVGEIIYILDHHAKAGRIMRNGQPVTGTGGEESIAITEFQFSEWNARTVFLSIEAVHRLTGQKFAVETAAVVLNQTK